MSVKVFKFPVWVTPALAFNNTTSLPLLLVESLSSTGLLDRLLLDGDTTEKAVNRAQSYFLVCAIVGNCLTFALGPRLFEIENAPDKDEDEEQDDSCSNEQGNGDANGDVERNVETNDELTSLLPQRVHTARDETAGKAWFVGQRHLEKLSPRMHAILIFLSNFLNAPSVGAVIGVIIGLTPPLHKAFFNDSTDGGFLNAWLTSSLKKIGDLFVTLQVVVVGVTLSSSLRKMKRGEDNGLPWLPTALILSVRLILWPVASISIIWLFATKTNVLPQDPIFWFAMMIMPTGPPAMSLVSIADVNGSDDEKMVIAKLLAVSSVGLQMCTCL